eukprot:NP_497560.1 Uncharacterized protein CELE_E02H9.4 [Caenorhabditis elegans]
MLIYHNCTTDRTMRKMRHEWGTFGIRIADAFSTMNIDVFDKGEKYNGNEKVELTTTVKNYKPKNNTRKWPAVEAKYLGVVYDNHNKLPKNCEGQKVEVQMMKIDKEQYGWVITDILNE